MSKKTGSPSFFLKKGEGKERNEIRVFFFSASSFPFLISYVAAFFFFPSFLLPLKSVTNDGLTIFVRLPEKRKKKKDREAKWKRQEVKGMKKGRKDSFFSLTAAYVRHFLGKKKGNCCAPKRKNQKPDEESILALRRRVLDICKGVVVVASSTHRYCPKCFFLFVFAWS